MSYFKIYLLLFTVAALRCGASPQGWSFNKHLGQEHDGVIEGINNHDIQDQAEKTEKDSERYANAGRSGRLQIRPMFDDRYEQTDVGSLIDKIQSNVFESLQRFNPSTLITQKDITNHHDVPSQITKPELLKLAEDSNYYVGGQHVAGILPRSVNDDSELFKLPTQAEHLKTILYNRDDTEKLLTPHLSLLPRQFLPPIHHPKFLSPIYLIERPPVKIEKLLPFERTPLQIGINKPHNQNVPFGILLNDHAAKPKINLGDKPFSNIPDILSPLTNPPLLLPSINKIIPLDGFRSISTDTTDTDIIPPRARAVLQKILDNLSVIQKSLQASITKPTVSQNTYLINENLGLDMENKAPNQLGALDLSKINTEGDTSNVPSSLNTPFIEEETNSNTDVKAEDPISILSEPTPENLHDALNSELESSADVDKISSSLNLEAPHAEIDNSETNSNVDIPLL